MQFLFPKKTQTVNGTCFPVPLRLDVEWFSNDCDFYIFNKIVIQLNNMNTNRIFMVKLNWYHEDIGYCKSTVGRWAYWNLSELFSFLSFFDETGNEVPSEWKVIQGN